MTLLYNKKTELKNRKSLRRNSTKAEKILWQYLRNRKFLDLKFRRQYSVDQFVIDFYCSELKLAVELDGKIHLLKDVENHDGNRDVYLSSFGIKILRLKNEIVLTNIEFALELIKKYVFEISSNHSEILRHRVIQ